MPINLRASGVVPDGSITEAKLADNAVTENKLASNAVTSTKIATDAVNADKLTEDLALQHFLGTETELFHTGTTETSIAEFHFMKDSTVSGENWKSISFSTMIKSSDVGNSAQIRLRIDGTFFTDTALTTSLTYEKQGSSPLDISALSDGNHLIEVLATNDTALGVVTTNQLEIYLSKKTV